MKTMVVASNNIHKLEEFKSIIKDYNIITLRDINFNDDILETGKTFFDNALIKAKTVHEFLKNKGLEYLVVSDDSGLCVEALGGEPGVYSARYSGNDCDYQANRNKLLKNLIGKDREAYFICTILVYYPDETYKSYEGKTYGKITDKEIGKTDFCYDCIFYSYELGKTFGEASSEEKNSVSHRARALKKMLKDIR